MSPFNALFFLKMFAIHITIKKLEKKKKKKVWTCEYVYDKMLSKMVSNQNTIYFDWLVLVM